MVRLSIHPPHPPASGRDRCLGDNSKYGDRISHLVITHGPRLQPCPLHSGLQQHRMNRRQAAMCAAAHALEPERGVQSATCIEALRNGTEEMTSCRTASQQTLGTKTSIQMGHRLAFYPSIQGRGSHGQTQIQPPHPTPTPPNPHGPELYSV